MILFIQELYDKNCVILINLKTMIILSSLFIVVYRVGGKHYKVRPISSWRFLYSSFIPGFKTKH